VVVCKDNIRLYHIGIDDDDDDDDDDMIKQHGWDG